MKRDVSSRLRLTSSGPAQLNLAIAAADAKDENLRIRQNGQAVEPRWVFEPSGSRFAVASVQEGPVEIDYEATVTGRSEPARVSDLEEIVYLRPSRYCESDTLAPLARAEFSGKTGAGLLAAVSSWVGVNLSYVPGSSQPTDGAVSTLLARQGVCRDYAHLVVALLRSLQVPARLASVYAPGLDPMDFHAVAEAAIDGVWRVVDATALAPRSTLLRIATGRDASDSAFLDVHGAAITLDEMTVTAVADALPDDDVRDLISIG